jgi:hypothetical protein
MVAVVRLVAIDEIAPRRAEACNAAASECLVLGGVQRHRRCIVNPPAQCVRRDAGWSRAQSVHVIAPVLAVSSLPVREASRKRPRRGRGAAIAERDGEGRIRANAAISPHWTILPSLALSKWLMRAMFLCNSTLQSLAIAAKPLSFPTKTFGVPTLSAETTVVGEPNRDRVPLAMSAEFVPSHQALLFAPPPAMLGFASR